MTDAAHVAALKKLRVHAAESWASIRHLMDPTDHEDADELAALDSAIQALEKAGLAVCMWCGAERPSRTETTAKEVADHLFACEKHPMRVLEAEIATLKAALEAVNAGMDHAADCWMATAGPAECNCPMKLVREALGLTPEGR